MYVFKIVFTKQITEKLRYNTIHAIPVFDKIDFVILLYNLLKMNDRRL